MRAPQLRTLRYARAWLGSPQRCEEEEILLDRGDRLVPGTIVRPLGARGPLPAWVVLHGITRRGRAHEQLQRFTRALVDTGAVAIVPDVPEWRQLELAPRLAVPTIRAAIAGLRASAWGRDEPVGTIGFSFGAPHVIAATSHPDLADAVAGSVGFGAYCSLERTARYFMTGMHEWGGRAHHLPPDAYGRWILAANYLTAIPEHAAASDAAFALRSLAMLSGDLGLVSTDPRLDVRKLALRASVAEERRWLFDLFAPPAAALPDPAHALHAAEALAAAGRRTDPEGEPSEALANVSRPVHVLHGRRDTVIPFSEGLRLRAALPSSTWSRVTVTSLFGHAGEGSPAAAMRSARELPSFLRALRGVLRLV
jgi:pimeloyl-ACP methyl ester carboxylesterase